VTAPMAKTVKTRRSHRLALTVCIGLFLSKRLAWRRGSWRSSWPWRMPRRFAARWITRKGVAHDARKHLQGVRKSGREEDATIGIEAREVDGLLQVRGMAGMRETGDRHIIDVMKVAGAQGRLACSTTEVWDMANPCPIEINPSDRMAFAAALSPITCEYGCKVPCITRGQERRYPKRASLIGSAMVASHKAALGSDGAI